jgi:hypothetical protein
MKIFPLIEQVLDELYSQIPGREASKDEEVNRSLATLSEHYRHLVGKDEAIDYSQPATRLAYIYKYVTCHSNLVYTRIPRSSKLADLFNDGTISVACLGGGPGSDFLGILKYCIEYNKKPDLRCQLYDREIAWGESWEDVDDKIKAADKLHTRTVYQPLDVTRSETYLPRSKYLNSDLFTMIYFVSEVYGRLGDGADDYFEHLFAGMRKGAQLLYIDNNHSEFTNWVEKKFDAHNLTIVKKGEGKEALPTEEEKKDLGKWYRKFSSSPKLEADVAWRIARKR